MKKVARVFRPKPKPQISATVSSKPTRKVIRRGGCCGGRK